MGGASLGAGQIERYGAYIGLDAHKTRLPLPELAKPALSGNHKATLHGRGGSAGIG